MSRSQDLRRVINGLLKAVNANINDHQTRCETIIRNSNIIKVAQEASSGSPKNNVPKDPNNDLANLIQRASLVPRGMLQFLEVAPKYMSGRGKPEDDLGMQQIQTDLSEEVMTIREEDLEGIYLKSLGVEILHQNEDGKRYEESLAAELAKERNTTTSAQQATKVSERESVNEETPLMAPTNSKDDVATMHRADNHRTLSAAAAPVSQNKVKVETRANLGGVATKVQRGSPLDQHNKATESLKHIKPLSTKKPTSQLLSTSKQRKVPATRISRLVTFGGLAAGLGIGTITEMTKRSLGLANPKNDSLMDSSPFLNEANAERIVDTLCRVRGAALKIGQILSIQDNSLMNNQLQKIFERVRNAADFMPGWQMEKILSKELGADWRSKLLEFDEKPFAAASIGQVHLGKLHDGRPVAIKIQYPGVAQGINSDIDNLMSLLTVWNVIPEGVYINKIVEVAKRELAWEVDYLREAKCAKRFRKLLENCPDYYVPEIIDELSTRQVYTTELIEGVPVDKCENLDQDTRDRICFLMLDLFFRELFEFQFMQTDPNWSNFLYNKETKQIGLLDFGSSREYRNGFVDNYMRIYESAARSDKDEIIRASRDIGFLTGYESKVMENAHLESVMVIGEALRMGYDKYDFGTNHLMSKLQHLVPIMVKERLCPPPEEIYSLHRKLSGVFLLCSRLKGRVQCKSIFDRMQENYVRGRPDT